MKRTLYSAVFLALIVFGSRVFAQEPASSAVIQEPESSASKKPLQKEKEIKPKKPGVVFLDISLLPFEKSVDITRIKDRTVDLGSLLEPWEKQVPVIWPDLGIEFEGHDFLANISGGISYFDDGIDVRKNRSLELSGEESVWKILFGGQGFVEQEKVPSVINGIQFSADHERLSYGVRGWGGAKFGDFNSRYLALKLGGGYIWTNGQETYRAPFRDIEPIPLYDGQYKNFFVAVESRIDFLRRFSYRSRAEKNFYEKVYKFRDTGMYGLNSFNDLVLESSLEALPVLRVERVRLVFKGRLNLDKEDGLLFRDSPAYVQVLLRLRLK